MRPSRSQHDETCRYKQLYEGSQASLSDMASRHSAALGRVSLVRAGLLKSLKTGYPQQVAQTERSLGRKIDGEPDEVLLALLTGLLSTVVPVGLPSRRPTGLDELRSALEGAGYLVGATDDLAAWAQAVTAAPKRSSSHEQAPPTPSPEESLQPAPVAAPAGVPAGAPIIDEQPPALSEDELSWAEADNPELAGLFSPQHEEPAVDTSDWDLTSLFDEAAPAATSEASEDAEALFDALFDDAPVTQETAAPAPAPAPVPAVQTLAPAPQVPARPAEPEPDPAPAAPDDTTVLMTFNAKPTQVKLPDPHGRPARTNATVMRPQAPQEASGRGGRQRNARPTKERRVAASAPSDAPAEAAAPVAVDRFDELTSLVQRPEPTFQRDLVKVAGSEALVAAWRDSMNGRGDAPVRQIGKRNHHAQRGPLYIPVTRTPEGGDEKKSLWSECLSEGKGRSRLRGATLYEVAVLAQRFGDEVVSFRFTDKVLTMQLSTPAGLVGVVMWVGPAGGTDSAREALAEAVESMINDRLARLMVLTHEIGERSVTRLRNLVAEEGSERGWRPAMPVLVSHSWDFAADSGVSALAAL